MKAQVSFWGPMDPMVDRGLIESEWSGHTGPPKNDTKVISSKTSCEAKLASLIS